MVGKEHLKDYILEAEIDEKGKLIEKAKYIGSYFEIEGSKEKLKIMRKEIIILHMVSWILVWIPLMFYSQITHINYVIVSYVLLNLVLLFQASSIYTLYKVKFPCKRQEKEKIQDRFMGSIVIEIFCLIWTLGAIILAGVSKKFDYNVSNSLFVIAAIVLFIVACFKLEKGNRIKFKEMSNTE